MTNHDFLDSRLICIFVSYLFISFFFCNVIYWSVNILYFFCERELLMAHGACGCDLKELMVEPAVDGTKNVIIAAAEAKLRRVVFTSSIGAVYMDPNRGPDVVVDESCWSDLEFCKNTKVNYTLSFSFSMSLYNSDFKTYKKKKKKKREAF